MSISLTFDPLFPTYLIFAMAAAMVGLVGVMAWHGMRAWAVRATASALLILALFNPIIQREDRETLPAIAALIVDESGSQELANRPSETEEAVSQVKAQIAEIGGIDVREVRSGDHPNDEGTALFEQLASAVDDVSPDRFAGAIMITDGVVHDIPSDLGSLGFSAPLHALITGNNGEKDRRIVLEQAPRFAILGEPQTLQYRVIDPTAGSEEIIVTMRIDGEPVLSETVIANEMRTLSIPLDHAGTNIVELEVEPVDEELTLTNNLAVAEIDVVRERLRVLLVSGEPHSGERTWRNVLKSDTAVDLVHFTILRPPEKQDGTPINELSLIAFPTRELFSEKIDEFDLIIFDRYQLRGVLPLLYFDNIAQYVENGGAVLVAAGADFAGALSLSRTPLETILPAIPTGGVMEEPFRPSVSSLGEKHPVTRNLPGAPNPLSDDEPSWSHWFRLIDADAVAGNVTMQGPNERPLLVLSREGDGRVALLLSDHAWLWARGFEGGGPHGVLLRRLVHWLMQEPDLDEEALTARADGADLVIERQTLSDDVPAIVVTQPSGEMVEIVMRETDSGLWSGRLDGAPLGLHRASDGVLTALAHIGPANPKEYQDVISTTDLLSPLAEQTGGSVIRIADNRGNVPAIRSVSERSPTSGNGWIGLKRSQATILRSIDRLPLFGGLIGFALLLGAFSGLWWREGR